MAGIPASHRDLLERNEAAILATVGTDGVPQVTAVSFVLDAAGLPLLSLSTARQKTRNLRRHPECTLFFFDPANPYRTLEIRTRAELRPDPDYAVADRVGAKYGADPRALTEPGESRVAVRFAPIKVNTYGQ